MSLGPAAYPAWSPTASVVSFERREFHPRLVWHGHAHPELTLVLDGRGLRGLGGAVEPYDGGDLCLLPPGTAHAWQGAPGARVRALVVHFSRAAVAAAGTAPELAAVTALLSGARGGLVVGGRTRDAAADDLLRLAAEPHGSWRRPLRLLDVLGALASSSDARPVGAPPAQVDRALRDVLAWIERHSAEPLSPRALAARAGLSPSAFSRAIKRAVGRTFEEHVNDLRVARAREALAARGRSITDIAFDVGYGSVAHFNRRFRRSTGVTPSAFRRGLS